MTAGDSEVVRRFLDAFNRNDVDTGIALTSAEVELYPLRAQLEARPYVGHDGLLRLNHDIRGDWDELHLDLHEVIEAPDGVVGVSHLRARGRTSGVDLDVPFAWHFRLRDGQITFGRSYSDPAEALRVAGADPATN